MATILPEWLTQRSIAHRGLHRAATSEGDMVPENSLAAFGDAADAGYPAELDVRLLADGAVVVFHDTDTERMTGITGAVGERSAEDVSDLRLLGTAQRIPLLEEVLSEVAGRTPLLIELKSDADTSIGPLEDAVLRLLNGYNGPFALQSFRAETVAYLKQAQPSWTVGQLAVNDRWREETPETPPPDFLAYSWKATPTPLTIACRALGKPLLVWTVQTWEEQAQVIAVADNFIFDEIRP